MVAEKAAGLVVEEGEDIRLLLIHFCLGNKIYISTGMAVGFVTGDQRQARNNPTP